jgi:hypothetical protein
LKNSSDRLFSGGPGGGPKTIPLGPSGPSAFDWLTAGQFALSVIAGLLLFGAFLFSGLALSLGTASLSTSQLTSAWMYSWGMALAAFMMVPSAIFSGRRLFGSARPDDGSWHRYLRLSWVFPLVILLGYVVERGPSVARVTLPIIHVLANTAGVFWILHLLGRRLRWGGSQRFWGGFTSGLAFVPPITFLIEIMILIALVLLWVFILHFQPDLQDELANLLDRISRSTVSPVILQRILGRVLAQPGVAATGLIYISVLIPVVEEILKPLGVWILLGRKLSPRAGFALGATAGAGYALFENLTIGAYAEGWTLVAVSRLGTAALHIFASGLVGWGLSSAVTEKRYLRLAGALLAAISLHGVWNGLNILDVLVDFPELQGALSPFGYFFAAYSPAGLVLIGLGCLGGILLAGRRLGKDDIMAGSGSV